jgi:hypothetical protein
MLYTVALSNGISFTIEETDKVVAQRRANGFARRFKTGGTLVSEDRKYQRLLDPTAPIKGYHR